MIELCRCWREASFLSWVGCVRALRLVEEVSDWTLLIYLLLRTNNRFSLQFCAHRKLHSSIRPLLLLSIDCYHLNFFHICCAVCSILLWRGNWCSSQFARISASSLHHLGAMGEESPQYALRCQLFGHEEDVSSKFTSAFTPSFLPSFPQLRLPFAPWTLPPVFFIFFSFLSFLFLVFENQTFKCCCCNLCLIRCGVHFLVSGLEESQIGWLHFLPHAHRVRVARVCSMMMA